MSKHCSDRKQSQVPGQEWFQVRVSVPMPGALVGAGGTLQELCVETGCQVLVADDEGRPRGAVRPQGPPRPRSPGVPCGQCAEPGDALVPDTSVVPLTRP